MRLPLSPVSFSCKSRVLLARWPNRSRVSESLAGALKGHSDSASQSPARDCTTRVDTLAWSSRSVGKPVQETSESCSSPNPVERLALLLLLGFVLDWANEQPSDLEKARRRLVVVVVTDECSRAFEIKSTTNELRRKSAGSFCLEDLGRFLRDQRDGYHKMQVAGRFWCRSF